MTQTYVPQEFIDRLENWGRVYRGSGNRPMTTTATYRSCEIMKEKAGVVTQSDKPIKLNEDDARIIEWCFARADVRLNVIERSLIKAHYVHRINPIYLCRKFRIGRNYYNDRVNKATYNFYHIVMMLAS